MEAGFAGLEVPRRQFIEAHTRPEAPPFVPEVELRLADEVIALWESTEQRSGARQAPPFWAFAWAGGLALARYVLDNPQVVRGLRVLDLAAGSGLVAVAAAKAGGAEVTAAEVDPLAVTAIGVNAAANGVTVHTVLGDVLDVEDPGVDVVLAGDVCYSREMTARVLAFLERARHAGARVLLGDPGRAYLPRAGFTALATYSVPVLRTLEDSDVKTVTVWQPAVDADA